MSESLDYTPGVFTMERHCRGRWACAKCQPPIQAPVPAQFIDDDPINAVLRGIGLLQKEFLSQLIDPVSEAADLEGRVISREEVAEAEWLASVARPPRRSNKSQHC